MPKGQKGPTDAKSVYVKFTRADDIEMYNQFTEYAEQAERDLGHWILIQLRYMYTSKQSQAPGKG